MYETVNLHLNVHTEYFHVNKQQHTSRKSPLALRHSSAL
jgi:hypothetical protein